MGKKLLVIPSIGVIALAAAACGSTSSSDSSTSAQGGGDDNGTSIVSTPQSAVKKGGILRVAADEDYDYWDGLSYYGAEWSIGYITSNGLLDLPSSTDPAEQKSLVPGIAADMPKVSSDGKTYTFTIRKGLKFNNGQPVTPADVKDTYERNLSPKAAFTDSVLGSGYYNGIVGFDEYQKGAPGISGIKINGDDVSFTLKAPDPAFQYYTALRFMTIIPKGTPRKHTLLPPPSTGPYMLTDYKPKRSATLRRNPLWPNNAKIMGVDESKLYNIDGIDFKLGVPADQQLLQIKNNQLDYSMDEAAPSGSAVAEVSHDPSLKGRYFSFLDSALSYIFMNTTVPPFNNVKLRQAANYAVDRSALTTITGGRETGQPWDLPLPKLLMGEGSQERVYPDRPDVAKAKQLVQESGLKTPVKATYTFVARPDNEKVAQALKAQMAKVGINLTIKAVPASTYYQLVTDPKNKVQLGFAGWAQDFPDPIAFFAPLLKGGSGSNYAQFNQPEINKAIDAAALIPFGDERTKAFADLAVKTARDYAPWITYRNRRAPYLISNRYGNFVWSPLGQQVYYGLAYVK